MKVTDLIDRLMTYNDQDEIGIEVYETTSGKYVDLSYDITHSEEDRVGLMLKPKSSRASSKARAKIMHR